jgi:hypothetical protein
MLLTDAQTASFSLYGLTISVEWDKSECGDEVLQLLAPFPFVPLAMPVNKADICLSFCISEAPANNINSIEAPNQHFGLKISRSSHGYFIHDEQAVFQANPNQGLGHVTLHPAFLDKTLFDKCNFFLVGFFHLLLEKGFFDLHAAGVIHDNTGYLLIGHSGSGKSTTTLSLVHQGWDFVSDDALLLHRNSLSVEALAFRTNFFIDPGLSLHWPTLVEHFEGPLVPGNAKRVIDMRELFPNQAQERVLPEVLIFTGIAQEAKSVLTPLSQSEALIRLLAQSASLSFNNENARNHLDVLKQLVSQTQSYQLQAGRDVYENPGKLAELLSSVSQDRKNALHCSKSVQTTTGNASQGI